MNYENDLKQAVLIEIVKNFDIRDATVINENGTFTLNLQLTVEQMKFVLLNFNSKEQFFQAFIEAKKSLTNDSR